jgi:hypothetical protein
MVGRAELNCRHEDFQTSPRVFSTGWEKPSCAFIHGLLRTCAIDKAPSGQHRRTKPPQFRHTQSAKRPDRVLPIGPRFRPNIARLPHRRSPPAACSKLSAHSRALVGRTRQDCATIGSSTMNCVKLVHFDVDGNGPRSDDNRPRWSGSRSGGNGATRRW